LRARALAVTARVWLGEMRSRRSAVIGMMVPGLVKGGAA
jgi:hypothetical protein